MDKPGRKPKRSPEREQAILNHLTVGNTRRASHLAAGVSHQTFYNWLQDATFLDAVEKAEAAAEQRFLGQVAVAARTQWQAAAWWLERRRNAEYARHDRVDVSIDVRKEAERIAAEQGLDQDEVFAEMQAILRGAK